MQGASSTDLTVPTQTSSCTGECPGNRETRRSETVLAIWKQALGKHTQAAGEQHPSAEGSQGWGQYVGCSQGCPRTQLPPCAHLCEAGVCSRSRCGPGETFGCEQPSVTLVPDCCPQCRPVNIMTPAENQEGQPPSSQHPRPHSSSGSVVILLAGLFFLSLQSLEHVLGRAELTRYQVQRSD